MGEAFDLEAEGSKEDGPRNKAGWARILAAEIRRQGIAETKEVAQANGEAVPPQAKKLLYDTLTVETLRKDVGAPISSNAQGRHGDDRIGGAT